MVSAVMFGGYFEGRPCGARRRARGNGGAACRCLVPAVCASAVDGAHVGDDVDEVGVGQRRASAPGRHEDSRGVEGVVRSPSDVEERQQLGVREAGGELGGGQRLFRNFPPPPPRGGGGPAATWEVVSGLPSPSPPTPPGPWQAMQVPLKISRPRAASPVPVAIVVVVSSLSEPPPQAATANARRTIVTGRMCLP